MTDEKEGTSLAPIPETLPEGVHLTMQQRMSPAALNLRLWTTIDTESEEGKAALIVHMAGGDSRAVAEKIGEVVQVEHIIVHSVEGVDDNGEEWEGERAVLIAPDGSAVHCVSRGLIKALQLLFGLYGVPPWKPARSLKIVQLPTKRGRRTFTLIPAAMVKAGKAK